MTQSAKGSWVDCDVKLTGKTVLITGANSGIGLETAIDLAKRGARIILACRNAERAQAAQEKVVEEAKCDPSKAVVKILDLNSLESIRNFAADVNANEERLDILINNAGVMMCPQGKTDDGFETQFGVNHLGHFLLTNLLLDLIKKSAPSRIVVLSSIAHTRGKMNWKDLNNEKSYDAFDVYRQSKLANLLFARHLSKLLQGSGVTVNSVHPGVVQTELGRHMQSGAFLYRTVFRLAMLPGVKSLLGIKTPVHGAQTSIYCAVAPELSDVSGKYFSDCRETQEAAAARNDDDAEKLWRVSMEMTKLDQ